MGRGMMSGDRCPMVVDGTTVTARGMEGGAALEFTADDEESVAEVQRRVRAMAERHNAMAGAGRGRGMAGQGMGMDMGMGPGRMMNDDGSFAPMPRATVRAIETKRGASLVFEAAAPDDMGAPQRHIAVRAERMQSGQRCPMGMMSMRGMAPADTPG